jgi:predicted metal-dependent peptidase
MRNAIDIDEQTRRFEKCGRRLVFEQPFFAALYLQLRKVRVDVDSPIQTMAVDGTSLFWNPAFVAQLNDAGIMCVQAHESMHCALLHFDRMKDRDRQRWNIATDYVINYELTACGFELPKFWHDASGKLCKPVLDDGTLGRLTAEDAYRALPDNPPDDESGEGEGEGPSKPQDSGDGKPGKGNGKPGKGNGKPGNGTPEASGMGDVLPAPGNAAQQEESRVNWQIAVRQAALQAAKHAGHVPGCVKALIAELDAPKVDWRDVLRKFAGESMSHDTTWARPNRRYVASGLYLPTKDRSAISKLGFIFDTSGSLFDPESQRAALSELQGMLDDGLCESIVWAMADTRVAATGECSQGESLEGFETKGGGGTNFNDAMRWAAEQDDCACFVYFTDGYTESWGTNPGKPVLWLGYGPLEGWQRQVAQAPFGESVHIPQA